MFVFVFVFLFVFVFVFAFVFFIVSPWVGWWGRLLPPVGALLDAFPAQEDQLARARNTTSDSTKKCRWQVISSSSGRSFSLHDTTFTFSRFHLVVFLF